MSVLPIRIWGDPCLRQVAVSVVVGDIVRQLAADMIDTMYAAPGRGLAAPQVGVGLRMFVMDAHWKDGKERDPLVVLNPQLSHLSGECAPYIEGCLSLPGILAEVMRPVAVTMQWEDLDGAHHARRLTGFEATCAQHEIDHLDGIMIPDRIDDTGRTKISDQLAVLVVV